MRCLVFLFFLSAAPIFSIYPGALAYFAEVYFQAFQCKDPDIRVQFVAGMNDMTHTCMVEAASNYLPSVQFAETDPRSIQELFQASRSGTDYYQRGIDFHSYLDKKFKQALIIFRDKKKEPFLEEYETRVIFLVLDAIVATRQVKQLCYYALLEYPSRGNDPECDVNQQAWFQLLLQYLQTTPSQFIINEIYQSPNLDYKDRIIDSFLFRNIVELSSRLSVIDFMNFFYEEYIKDVAAEMYKFGDSP